MRTAFALDMPGNAVWAFCPDHLAKVGATDSSNMVVTVGAVTNSLVMPRDGWIWLTFPSGAAARMRLALSAVAVATDQLLTGPDWWTMPVLAGHRLSLFGETAFTASVSMVKKGYP